MRVAVIGGGPSGLVQLKVLVEAHQRFPISTIEVKLFEAHEKVGGVFLTHSYEDAELVSSKYFTAFSDFRPRANDADFFSAQRYRDYLDEYASYFRLWPFIHLSTRVLSVRRGDAAEHVVTYQRPGGDVVEWDCDAIAVCSGLHARPNQPKLAGAAHVPVVLHSQDFKSRAQFGSNKTVMVLGSGETAVDVSYLALTSPTDKVIMCHRDGWLGAPKRVPAQRFFPWLFGSDPLDYPQLPLDSSQPTLFDSMYVHPIVRDSMIIWNAYHVLALPLFCWMCSGSPRGIDQFVGQINGERFHASRVIFNKAWQRIQNYASYPWRPEKWSWATRVKRFFFHTDIPPPPRVLDVAPFPSHISEDGVAHFPLTDRPESKRIQDQVIKPDVLIFATGYTTSFPFLNTPAGGGQRAYPSASDANVRQIWKADDPTVGFIGFVRPGFGAIPPLAELQAMLFAMHLAGCVPRPLDPADEWHYRILAPPDARVRCGVEHDSYAYQLAKDMDVAPSVTEVVRLAAGAPRGWRLPWVWAAGGPFNVKFRLRGPWKWHGAAETMTGELWETIERREGLFGDLALSVPYMIALGGINLFYYLYAELWAVLVGLRLARPWERSCEPKRIMAELAKRLEMETEMEMNGRGGDGAKSNVTSKINGVP